MAKKNYIKIIFCTVLALACMFSFGEIDAYAASLKAPSVTAESASATSVKLKWKKNKAAKKFTIYRSTKKNKGFKAVKTVKKSTLTYTDKKLTCGKTYYYKVKAINGKKSKTSKVKKVKVAPVKVKTISAASSKCGEITVTYGKSSGASGYQLSCSPTANGKFTVLNTSNQTSFTHSLNMGTAAYYKVRAYKTVKGKKVYSSYSKVVSATALSHSYGAPVTLVNATCKSDGSQSYTCTYCGNSYTQVTPAVPHNYVQNVVAPTCGADGYTLNVCLSCKDTFKSNITPATGNHTYSRAVILTPATCTTNGTQAQTCTVCGKIVTTIINATGHSLDDGTVTKEATCTENGTLTKKCKNTLCNYSETSVIPALGHDYQVTAAKDATCTEGGYVTKTCSRCGDAVTQTTPALGHDIKSTVVTPTCTEPGYTTNECTRCDFTETVDITNELGHSTDSSNYRLTEDNKLVKDCTRCNEPIVMTTYTVDLSNLADFELSGVSKYESAKNKLTLISSSIVSKFELSGSAENLTVSLDATDASIDTEIKLNNASINNSTFVDDCIRINDKSPLNENEDGTDQVPLVSISAKDGTTNTLIVAQKGGNAIDSNAKLELKGHGLLNLDTVSTSINSIGKITIKNLTLNIKSQNRGIDTKEDIKDTAGNIVDSDYANIDIDANANITINSTDDGIRCKNLEFLALNLDKNADDVGTVVNIKAGADGIQLEGKKGITMNSGSMTLSGSKYDINCKKGSITVNSPATLTYSTTNCPNV